MTARTIGRTADGHEIKFGTAADMAALTAILDATVQFWRDDGSKFRSNGAGGWVPISIAGAGMVTDAPLWSGPIYNDGTYKYFGEALSAIALNVAGWRVSRMNISTSQVQYADGNTNFDNLYTDQATVAALSYS